jgi:hypothetical protein
MSLRRKEYSLSSGCSHCSMSIYRTIRNSDGTITETNIKICALIWITYIDRDQILNVSIIFSEECPCKSCIVKGMCEINNRLTCNLFKEKLNRVTTIYKIRS